MNEQTSLNKVHRHLGDAQSNDAERVKMVQEYD